MADSLMAFTNVSTKFNSFFRFPARFIARMQKIDELLNKEADNVHIERHGWESTGTFAEGRAPPPPPPGFAPLPGPWGFLTSGYLLGLIAMAVLLNRIQNIVVPSRNPFAARVTRHYRRNNSLIRSIYYSILPLNFSSTFCRLIFRVPSLYLIGKAVLYWTVILLQTSGFFATWNWTSLQALNNFVAQKEMENICWFTYCAVCAVLVVEALTRGLEGVGASANTSPFNLFGYAFLLHIYSSPMTHAHKPQGLPSRPDKHVVVTILMPLVQLIMVHTLGIKQRWSRQRLIPTGIVSLVSLTHFHVVLWLSPTSYPLLNYTPCLFESALVLITALTIGLNALTQLLLEGAVTRPLFGHQATLLPKWDEDFSIVLLRLGTASLEATSVAGLGNEVGGVSVLDSMKSGKTSAPETEYGTIEMNRFGVTSISHATVGGGKQRKVKHGFANEIKNIKTTSADGRNESWLDYDMLWYRELAKFGVGVAKCARGCWRLVTGAARRRIYRGRLSGIGQNNDEDECLREGHRVSEDSHGAREGGPGIGIAGREDEPDLYERFIRGEAVTDDEDDEFELRHAVSRTSSVSETPSVVSDTPDEDQSEYAGETVGLYTDLSAGASTGASAPLLLAHMTDASSSPLTRRRYTRLVASEPESEGWDDVIRVRRRTAEQREAEEDSATAEMRRNCVICTAEPRQIICWPCRCLAMCDDCRENLASRSAAAKHACPCCRRNVEGYSKIFIP